MAELPRWATTNADGQKQRRRIHIDLRRSLEMHRWLALGVALAGTALAGVYLLVFWPGATAQTHAAGVAFNTILILFTSALLGAAAAVVAHHRDPRIYIAADVEHWLGIAPIGQLADFSEVTAESAQEQFAALAKEIAQACSEGSVRRCVFTGTGIGAGVTTLAAGTKEALVRMGRATVLVDAAWSTAGENAVMVNAADESGSHDNSLILTDTSPLAESPDTEFLARFADCVIVVVESGVTTREQLKAAEDCLKRLNVATAGFVVNRVRQLQNGSALREVLKARRSSTDGESVGTRKQFNAAVHRALAEAPKRPIEAAGNPMGKPPAKPFKRTTALTLVKRTEAPPATDWSAPGVPPWLTEALTKLEAAAPVVEHEPVVRDEDANAASKDRRGEKSDEAAIREAQTGQVSSDVRADANAVQQERSGAMLFEMNWMAPQPKTTAEPGTSDATSSVAAGLTARKSSRLSALRGKVSAADLKALNHGRAPETDELPQALLDVLRVPPERFSSLRGLVKPGDLKELGHLEKPPAAEPEAAAQDGAEVQTNEQVAQGSNAIAEGELLQSSTDDPENIPDAEAAPSKPPAVAPRDERGNYGEVQILPSKRGQYRRKK